MAAVSAFQAAFAGAGQVLHQPLPRLREHSAVHVALCSCRHAYMCVRQQYQRLVGEARRTSFVGRIVSCPHHAQATAVTGCC